MEYLYSIKNTSVCKVQAEVLLCVERTRRGSLPAFRQSAVYTMSWERIPAKSASSAIPRLPISAGQYACPRLTQAQTALGFFAVIRQKGYLIMNGVLKPTPNSRKRIFCPSRVRRKLL